MDAILFDSHYILSNRKGICMDAANTNEHPVAFTSVVGKTAKINKYVLLGLNALFALPFVVRNYSVQGLVTYLIAMLLLFLVFLRSSDHTPAISELPLILLADVITYIGVHFLDLRPRINMDGLSSYFSDAGAFFWVLFLAGLTLGLVGISNKNRSWVTGFAGGLMGSSVILLGWSNCDINNFHFYGSGASLLLLFIILNFLWTVILYFIVKTTPEKTTGAIWIGIVLLCTLMVVLTVGTDYIREYLPIWKAGLLEWPHTLFAWWKVILSCVVLFVGIFTLYTIDGDNGNHLSVDAYALVVAGEIILTTKILMSNYFTLCGLILIGLIISTFKCMMNDYSGEKTLRLNSIAYLVAQYFTALLMIYLFRNGFWVNVLVSLSFFVAFYVEHNKPRKHYSMAHWIMILLCIVSETAAFVWRKCFSVDLLILLAVVLVASIMTISVINLKQPGERTAPDILRIIVCVCVAIVCLAAASRNSIKIGSEIEESSKTITIDVEAKGKNNSVYSAYYSWRDMTGKALTEDIEILGSKSTIEIESEVLTIVIEDAQGFVTSKIIWYPHWLHSILK